ncbi:hypothetical protein PIB30_069590 [Stylosanthes scabra]|uniref:Ribonuclease H1 N-terminal domain-containing protein n=1 Tax=Stylosanthes scabra TaxID=79078 RepID=A0ABU6WRL2_9FABA|nr:hypothetical protein [Stylosanthes scabra]
MVECYVVFAVQNPRIYMTWPEAVPQVIGVSGAVHQRYSTIEEELVGHGLVVTRTESSTQSRAITETEVDGPSNDGKRWLCTVFNGLKDRDTTVDRCHRGIGGAGVTDRSGQVGASDPIGPDRGVADEFDENQGTQRMRVVAKQGHGGRGEFGVLDNKSSYNVEWAFLLGELSYVISRAFVDVNQSIYMMITTCYHARYAKGEEWKWNGNERRSPKSFFGISPNVTARQIFRVRWSKLCSDPRFKARRVMEEGGNADASGAEESCVVAALFQLSETIAAQGRTLIKIADTVQGDVGLVGSMVAEMRNNKKLLEACLNVFVCPRMQTQMVKDKDIGTQFDGSGNGSSGGNGKQTPSQTTQGGQSSGGPFLENTSMVSEQGVTTLLPSLMGQWCNDTVMMGSMIQIDQVNTMPTPISIPDVVDVSGGRGKTPQPLHIPAHVRGKIQAHLGDDSVFQKTPLDGSSNPSKIQKVIDITPEEKKRSNKMRRAQREPTLEIYGTPKTCVTFPSFIKCRFKLTPQHNYGLGEAHQLAFIFGESMDPHEVLLIRGHRKMDREDFGILLPGNEPSDYIMELMAYRTAWTQSQLPQKTLWSLPVHFSEIVLNADVTIDRLISLFKP